MVFGKRDAFRRAFHGFDVAKVSTMTDNDVDGLMQDSSIIRNRAKIEATIANAQAMMSASPSLVECGCSAYATVRRAPADSCGRANDDAEVDRLATPAEVPGIPIHRADERVRVHAERRRGQRPYLSVLPRERLHACEVTIRTIR